MTLLAAFAVLLHRYTGQADICVGTPVANRTRSEIEGLIGFFVNTLVLRTDLGGAASFAEVLRRVREAALEAYAHQDLPFEKLVAELRPARDLSRNPLFQVMFILQNAPLPKVHLKGLDLNSWPSRAAANFDLIFHTRWHDGLRGMLITHRIVRRRDDRTAGRHYRTLLAGAVADPTRPVRALPLISDAERRQLLQDWNDTDGRYPDRPCIPTCSPTRRRAPPTPSPWPGEPGSSATPPSTPTPIAWPSTSTPWAWRPRTASPSPWNAPPADRRPAGRPQGRRRLRPARPDLPSRAAPLHAPGRPASRPC